MTGKTETCSTREPDVTGKGDWGRGGPFVIILFHVHAQRVLGKRLQTTDLLQGRTEGRTRCKRETSK